MQQQHEQQITRIVFAGVFASYLTRHALLGKLNQDPVHVILFDCGLPASYSAFVFFWCVGCVTQEMLLQRAIAIVICATCIATSCVAIVNCLQYGLCSEKTVCTAAAAAPS